MRFSIIVIGYNQKEDACKAISSVLGQSYRDLEVIYVDDASTDGSVEYIKSVILDKRLTIVENRENQGSSVARLKGIANANGEWGLFVDGDDSLCPNACEVISGIIDIIDEETDIVGFGANVISTNDTDKAVTAWMKEMTAEPIVGKHSSEEITRAMYIERKKAWVLWNKCFKMEVLRKAAEKASYEHIYRYTDCYLCFLACSEAREYYGILAPLYNYNFGPGISLKSINVDEMKRYMSAYQVSALLQDYTKEKRLPKEFEEALKLIGYETISQTIDKIMMLPEEDELPAAKVFLDYLEDNGLYGLLSKLRRQNEEITEQRAMIAEKNKELQAVWESKSYRVGRSITWIPRKIRNMHRNS